MSTESTDNNQPREYDLFNNPMVDAAREAMSPEDIQRYKTLGEEMFKVDFANEDPTKMVTSEEPILYILESVRSGQHPSTLEDSEKEFLKEYIGPTWYKQFGYTEQDLQFI